MNIVDGIVIIILIYAAFIGWRRGILKTVLSIVGFLLAIYIAYKFSPQLTVYLEKNFSMVTSIKHYLSDHLNLPPETKIISADPDNLKLYISTLPVPQFFKNFLKGNIPLLSSFGPNQTVYDAYLTLLGITIGEAISFIILFLLSMIVISIFKNLITGGIHKVPALGTLDRSLGLIFSVALYLAILIFLVFLYSNLFLKILLPDSNIVKTINSSYFVRWSQENMGMFKHLLSLIVSKVMELIK